MLFLIAQAGGGSSGFGGGGGGGGGGGFSGGGGSGGTGSGSPAVFLIIVALVGCYLAWQFFQAWRLRVKIRERDVRTRTASAAAAEDDAYFAAADVERDAVALYLLVQRAWDQRDRETLAKYVGKDLMVEWGRRLDDFDRKGWHNRVEVRNDPKVEYVGITNRGDDAQDRATVRLSCAMRSVVIDANGNEIRKKGEGDDEIAVAEYWTLARRSADDGWFVVSIEQDAEGAHHLDAPLVPTPWMDDETLRDEAIVEQAQADAAPAGTELAGLFDVDFADDARMAALDLSAVDERFAPHVLEVAVRRALSAWAEAVDGEDAPLLEVADATAVRELLYGGDASQTTRVVVRGPKIEEVRIVAVERTEPPSFTVEVRASGRRYVENRDTLAVVSGSRDDTTTFTERWRLVLGEDLWTLSGSDGV